MSDRRGALWPWLITAALLFTVGVNVVMLVAASSDRNGSVVEPDYYRKAVAWDSTMARRAASDRLGWRADVEVVRSTVGAEAPGRLTVRLRDAAGAPVTGAQVTAVLIHNTAAAHPISVALAEEGATGTYAGVPTVAHPGRWEVRVEATRAGAAFGAIAIVDAKEGRR